MFATERAQQNHRRVFKTMEQLRCQFETCLQAPAARYLRAFA